VTTTIELVAVAVPLPLPPILVDALGLGEAGHGKPAIEVLVAHPAPHSVAQLVTVGTVSQEQGGVMVEIWRQRGRMQTGVISGQVEPVVTVMVGQVGSKALDMPMGWVALGVGVCALAREARSASAAKV